MPLSNKFFEVFFKSWLCKGLRCGGNGDFFPAVIKKGSKLCGIEPFCGEVGFKFLLIDALYSPFLVLPLLV